MFLCCNYNIRTSREKRKKSCCVIFKKLFYYLRFCLFIKTMNLVFISIFVLFISLIVIVDGSYVLYDFTKNENNNDVNKFIEVSDSTERTAGLSKASFVSIDSTNDPRAVFFSLLVPQSDSACFAGIQDSSENSMNWESYETITLNLRRSGPNSIYKVVLRDALVESQNSSVTFEQIFDIASDCWTNIQEEDHVKEDHKNIKSTDNIKNKEDTDDNNNGPYTWGYVTLSLNKFVCSYHGQDCDYELHRDQVSSFGLQIAGGRYESYTQSGVGSLELRTIILA